MVDIPICPSCEKPATRGHTRWGIRDRCDACGLWSWSGRPLVAKEIHDARQLCHVVVDRLWNGPEVYTNADLQGSSGRSHQVRRIRRKSRNRVYEFLSDQIGIPEPDCHMAGQTDIEILRRIYAVAKAATPLGVRDWAKQRRTADSMERANG